MSIKTMSLEQLQRIDSCIPHIFEQHSYMWWSFKKSNYQTAPHSAFVPIDWVRASDIRIRISEIESGIAIGTKVVLFKELEITNRLCFVKEIKNYQYAIALVETGEIIARTGYAVISHDCRPATAEEEAAGYRIDKPVASCGATNADIDYFAEHHSSRPYVELPEFEERALGLNGEQAQILVDQANEIIGLNKRVNMFEVKIKAHNALCDVLDVLDDLSRRPSVYKIKVNDEIEHLNRGQDL